MNFRKRRPRHAARGCPCCTTVKYGNSLAYEGRTQLKDRPQSEDMPLSFHGRPGSKKKKPFAIESKWRKNPWSLWRRYRTERDRDQALTVLQRKARNLQFRAA